MTTAPSLSYLFAHPESVAFRLDRPIWLAGLAALALILWLAPRVSGRKSVVTALRCVALLSVLLALCGAALRVSLPDERLSVIALVDRSDSIDAGGRRWQERYVDQLAGALAPEDELGVLLFARETVVTHPPGSDQPLSLGTVPGAASTDIAQALDVALAMFPAERERRIVLLSDGNETRGDALSRAAAARAANVTIHTAVPPRAAGSDAAVDKLVVPPLVAEGRVFPIRVVIRNQGLAQPAQLTLAVNGTTIGAETIPLQAGLNTVEIPYRFAETGNHRLRATVQLADDTVPGNDQRDIGVMVGGRPRILLVSSRSRSALALVLERKGIDVQRVAPAELVTRLDSLRGYHAVILEEASSSAIPPRALDAIDGYVRDGGAFVVAAGESTYGDKGYRRTVLARLLPVTLEPKRPPRPEREPLSLYLIIDRSNSMGYHIHNRMERSPSESKLEYAKRAALAVIGQLRDSDRVGVIVFDSFMHEIAPLRTLAQNRALLERDIPRLVPGGGTDFFDALDEARRQLDAAHASLAHVMLLTDGDTNRSAADHLPVIDGLAKAGISVTAIRIGDDTVNLQLLSDIAQRTGGHFHHVENAELLPQLMLKDASRALSHAPRHDEVFAASSVAPSQLMRGIGAESLPPLNGYAFAKPKPGAEVVLAIDRQGRQDPLLAVWQYGLGRVVAFTASFADDAETWVGWEGFGKLWSQIVHWAMRDPTAWDLGVDVERRDGQATLVVQAFTDISDAVLMGQLQNHGEPIEIALVPTGPRTFRGRLPQLAGGRYPLTLLVRRPGRPVEQRSLQVTVPAQDADAQEEYEASGPNRALLEALAVSTGGALDAPIRTVVGRQLGTRYVDRHLDWLLLPLAMLCLLADVALRRLSPSRD